MAALQLLPAYFNKLIADRSSGHEVEFTWVDGVCWGFVALILFIAARTPNFLELATNFKFYGAYHQDHRNQNVHFFGVWPLVWTGLGLLSYSHSWIGEKHGWGSYLNVSLVGAVCYITYFGTVSFRPIKVSLAYKAPYSLPPIYLPGCISIALTIGGYFAVNALRDYTPETAWGYFVIGQVLSWCLQLWGHSVFEGQAPAFLHNIAQAFIMAPEFVIVEELFRAGWNPELERAVKALIEEVPLPDKNYKPVVGWIEFVVGVTFTAVGLMVLLHGFPGSTGLYHHVTHGL